MGGTHILKRVPRIKFPQRHPKSSGASSQTQEEPAAGDVHHTFFANSEIPASPTNTACGGKASLQPKRTPVSDKEIEAILLGGSF